ncbi:transglutaminase-like enzyme, predicted cysteine protease [Leptolyngbyaceae cyanobacterium JSC-12]|nr:transglutaminase-like enzyme, predicted cysteine protease [Leptolyngbyaceae cyanobacterium JSC-12]
MRSETVLSTDQATSSAAKLTARSRTIRPLAACVLQGICFIGNELIALDSIRGYLLKIDPETDNTTILNPLHVDELIGAEGLTVWNNTFWIARENSVYFFDLERFALQHFYTLPYPVNGLAIWEDTVYVASQKAGYIHIFERDSRRLITRLPMPGVGPATLAIRGEELWVCDRVEQTAFCIDRATGELRFSVLTPFESPTGITFHPNSQPGAEVLYVSYAKEEPYVRDNPNNPDGTYELSFRDRTFIHPLYFHYDPQTHYALSNGYLVEMSYAEELLPLEEVLFENLEWRIALPAETDRQKVRSIEPIGRPFVEEDQNGQRVAVFRFDTLKPNERHLFGWKAQLEIRAIKYQFTFEDVENIPALSPDFQAKYLVDDDELAMDTPIIRAAAREAIGTETNILRKMLKIRNYVYDRLSYALTPKIDTPDVVLERGIGSCGEYVGLLLALARLNGIACRTVGRYKCPPTPEQRLVPLEPDYNHVWIEFYIPGFGWVPMESNPDDIAENGPYPTRFFMGLPWYHAEIAKGIPFETLTANGEPVETVSIGELAINHVRFTVLDELAPVCHG